MVRLMSGSACVNRSHISNNAFESINSSTPTNNRLRSREGSDGSESEEDITSRRFNWMVC